MKPLFLTVIVTSLVLSVAAYAQTAPPAPTAATAPNFTWKIVLKTFLNEVKAVRTESYPDKNTCELARVGMDLSNLHLLGVHGECMFVPTTYLGRKHHRPVKAKG